MVKHLGVGGGLLYRKEKIHMKRIFILRKEISKEGGGQKRAVREESSR